MQIGPFRNRLCEVAGSKGLGRQETGAFLAELGGALGWKAGSLCVCSVTNGNADRIMREGGRPQLELLLMCAPDANPTYLRYFISCFGNRK